ncbi:hypothetical protein R5R35_000535 [Gryllus longicercus]|uniref:Selenocysteine-specific elongation factor n=1 Tax=Gryllus longicercus TaxID=2509291 RepID=A0AAN9ZDG5_9ORTH
MLNLNIGVLGHVDSGKTSLAKVLSTVAIDVPDHLLNEEQSGKLQFTLVDCPGHASLIRTIIGGAQIIDMMILVIDVTKGMQTQTAECLVIGEITCKKMVVVLNKTDLLPPAQRSYLIEKMSKKMKMTLKNTVFRDCPIVSIAANPGGSDSPSNGPEGINDLINILKEMAYVPIRNRLKPFLFAVDHCFSIRGQGTVLTGTVLQGEIKINDIIEIPALQATKKVKSLQMFRMPVEKAQQGDRLGICVTQFDPKLFERGLIAAPHFVVSAYAAIISIHKIKYFKGSVASKSRFHVTMGHDTVMARITIFGLLPKDYLEAESKLPDNYINLHFNYKYLDELFLLNDNDTEQSDDIPIKQYALLEFDKQLSVVPGSVVIGSKLDIDFHSNTCRLAFSGCLLECLEDKNYPQTVLPNLKVYKEKSKLGLVERVVNTQEVIVKKLFKKETNIPLFSGLKVNLSTGDKGVIEGSFGQSGKVKVRIPGELSPTTMALVAGQSKKRGKHTICQASPEMDPITVELQFKRLIYDPLKKIVQD